MHAETIDSRPGAVSTKAFPDPNQDMFSKNVLGFWMYLMTDSLIFASLFITYAVLHTQTFGGPTPQEAFDLTTTAAETTALLLSSVFCGFALLSSVQQKKNRVITFLIITFLLGATFIALELHEFYGLIKEGNSWEKSAFLSSFFTLVGTHGLHVSMGLIWMSVIIIQVISYGIIESTFRRLIIFGMFWHFLDLIWIFIFTFVYLSGVLL